MKSLRSLLTGLLLLGNLLLLAALSLHVVWAPGKLAVVAKDHLTLLDTYRDIRLWTPADAMSHPALLGRITDAGRLDLVAHIPNLPSQTVRVQTSSTTPPGYQNANPAIIPGLDVPASLVTQVQLPEPTPPAPANPLAKRSGTAPQFGTPTTKPAASNDDGSKTIFDFGR